MALNIMTEMTMQEILEKVQLQNAYLAAIAGADPEPLQFPDGTVYRKL